MESKPCGHCGARFTPRDRAQRYCSTACREAHRSRRRRVPRVPRVPRACEQCGAPYTPARSIQRYCSRPCAKRASYLRGRPEAAPATATCRHCGRDFDYIPKGKPRRFCSAACRKEAGKARRALQPPQEPPEPERKRQPRPPSSFPQGSLTGDALPASGGDRQAYCAVCGRPGGGETAKWRVHCYRTSPRADRTLAWICPSHFGTDPRLLDEILRASSRARRRGREGGSRPP